MKVIHIGSVAASVVMLFGCMSEQEIRERKQFQAIVPDIRSSIAAKDFDKAERLCDEGKSKCPTVDYDWAALKSHIAQSRQALRQKEYAEWKASDDGQASVSLEEFESKHKDGWRDRAKAKRAVRLEQEAKAAAEKRRLAEIERLRRQRAEIIDGIAQDDLKKIREAYAEHEPYRCTYPRSDRNADWLATWTEPRLEMTEADKLAGEALLSEFGTKYLPNAYANYEKVRERAIELQQVFNEEFPQPWTIDNANSKWSAFNKVLEKLAKARAEYFFCHDELCHYWMKQKFGVLPVADFATIDSQRLAVRLLPEDTGRSGHTLLDAQPMESEMSDFAAKYAPESYAVYKKLEQEDKEWGLLLKEVVKQHEQIDDVRFDRTLANAISKKNDIVREMSILSIMFQGWRMDHRMTEKTSEDIAKLDHEQALSMKCFIESLPTYVKDRTLGPVIPRSDMLPVPGEACRMQRTEVTQLQWMIVMGNNPSKFVGADRPVEQMSWGDLQTFIMKVSEVDGIRYSLPTESAWMTACLAGSRTRWGKRKNGVDGPLEVVGWPETEKSWRSGHHAVALKEPNAWGFYDMHGNVCELCKASYVDENAIKERLEFSPMGQTSAGKFKIESESRLVCCGGSCFEYVGHKQSCDVCCRGKACEKECSVGFRLVESVK